MTTITASVVLKSRNSASGVDLRTFLLRYPRWIHAEFMTHRVFSRNAASSRAIPVAKLIADVMENPAVPIHWGKNQRGMQATETHDGLILLDGEELTNRVAWLRARDAAVKAAEAFSAAGYHKQVVNRLIEPFAHITVVASATEVDNFYRLRCHADAEPHFRMLAEAMRAADDAAPVVTLGLNDGRNSKWFDETHAPFLTADEVNSVTDYDGATRLVRLSVARCASTSFKTVDGFDMTPEKADEIFDKLVNSDPMHASPLEHVAYVSSDPWGECIGNFRSFRQLRHVI